MSAFSTSPVASSGSALPSSPLDCHHIASDTDRQRVASKSSTEEPKQPIIRTVKRWSGSPARNRTNSHSLSSCSETTSKTSASQSHEHGEVRTLPPWIDSFEENDGQSIPSRVRDLLLPAPPQTHFAQHHYCPTKPERRRSQDGFVESDDEVSHEILPKLPERSFFGGPKEPDKGRKWDHVREGEPVIVQSGVPNISSRWRNFVKSSMYGPLLEEDGKLVETSFLDEQTPGYTRPWRGDLEGEDPEKLLGLRPSKRRRRMWYERVQYIIVMHPLVPLFFRVIVLTTSTIALGLSSSIYHLTHYSSFNQSPSTIMAIVVDVVAMPYIGYITWDEYTGKPLGLRPPKAKISLVLLDLFFIVFESANLALAFGSLTDPNGSCVDGDNGTSFAICSRLQTLSCFLFVALVAWILTFSVSILRLVERVGGRDENE